MIQEEAIKRQFKPEGPQKKFSIHPSTTYSTAYTLRAYALALRTLPSATSYMLKTSDCVKTIMQ
jgi:hypothetical protein